MANVFGILTAIVLALSVFVAFKNKAAYENEITETAIRERATSSKSEERLKIAQNSLRGHHRTKGPAWMPKSSS